MTVPITAEHQAASERDNLHGEISANKKTNCKLVCTKYSYIAKEIKFIICIEKCKL